jgi:hypothetical protein
MKNTFLFLFIFLNSATYSQLYVSNNTNVFAKDVCLFVKNDLNIEAFGTIYLREEAQLLQATTATSANKGLGKLSVFQEGTSNEYQYNYWCAPVGNSSASIGNENFGIGMLHRPSTLINSTPAITIAHADFNGNSNPLEIEPYWIWKYLNNTGANNWIHVQATNTLEPGQGFTMKGTRGIDATTISGVQNNPDGSHQRYDFIGKPNDGNVDVSVSTNNYTLIGNPYPSAIDLTAFLLDATNTTGTAYFWESDKSINSHISANYVGGSGTFAPISLGGTGIYVPATFYSYDNLGNPIAPVGSGINYQRRFCPIGQGFMVLGSSNGNVTFKNVHRAFVKEGAANFSQFERNAASASHLSDIISVSNFDYKTVSTEIIPQIRFKNVIGLNGTQVMVMAFAPNATDKVDFGMDAPSPKDITEQELYFLQDNAPYIINVTKFDINKRFPIGFRNQQIATFKVSVAEMLNFNGTNTVYIHDKINDIYYDIANSTFEKTMPIGDNRTQYEITFTNLSLSIAENISNDFDILQNNQLQSLIILNPKNNILSEVNLYDIAGKLIVSKSKLGLNTNYKINTTGFADGIYIAKITTADNKIQTQKVAIKNIK